MPTGGADIAFPPAIDSFSMPDGVVDFEDGPKHHATLHRQYGQAIAELERLAQLSEYHYGMIYDVTSGQMVARNEKTAEQQFGPGTVQSVYSSVITALSTLGPTSGGFQTPGGKCWIGVSKPTNDVIPFDDTLPGCHGLHLRGAGFARKGISGLPDINPILRAVGFASGAKPAMDLSAGGTAGLENVVLDGVSIDAQDVAETALRAWGMGTANAMSIFRCAFQGGTKEALRVGDTGSGASTDLWISHSLIHHNKPKVGVTERALMSILGGDFMGFANAFVSPQGNAVGVLMDPGVAGAGMAFSSFYSKVGTDGNGKPGLKMRAGAMNFVDLCDFIGFTDATNGGLWVAPSSSSALKTPELTHNRFRPGAAVSHIVLDGGGAGSGFGAAFLRIHGVSTPGFVGGTIPQIVKGIGNFDAGSSVFIEKVTAMLASKVWAVDGSTSWAPANLDGNICAAGNTLPLGQCLGEQWIVPSGGVTIAGGGGESAGIAHSCYGTPDIVDVSVMGATPAAGRISARATSTQVFVESTAGETALPVAIFVKMTSS